MRIVTIIGARPQFIKAAPVSRAIRRCNEEILVHTGQHYDENMSEIFFHELDIPLPDYNLAIGSGSHGWQTGHMLIAIEDILLKSKPDAVLVYGDTNSTLAGALAASKLLIPLVHVEAGLRSFNKAMPEEQNRILTDHVSDMLLCPTQTAVANLAKEGIRQGVYNTGDVMYDAVLYNKDIARTKSDVLARLNLQSGGYILATVHRAENTDNKERLSAIIEAFNRCGERIVFPVHPRTLKYISEYGLALSGNIMVIEPVGYLDMLMLESNAAKIVTDSGGVQKEAYFLGIPCITLRRQTEWVETVSAGWNIIADSDERIILNAIRDFNPSSDRPPYFGDGHAAQKIAEILDGVAV
ncbi:non-hydrolyzing UDP-N-acetylglucosamine 2-epimerase [Mahella australiensis]|uniref:UDP-N-acetylglucosamine 2-epimerase n=1 Tax=Mahella australiensis (strain DSM 15567 / CIP 107919 / 50-1 BON) TaxID=697281 RepID=F3ZXR7_MAHA5|nr:UDP-N-acetylglucosamine 2-epimerase (non-hydrolyzing) [Mahella australiensis]AEE95574.1 UDP-N-acetylglucosamine 2-epimerase [Mahella australiensis 50-1 BON]